MLSNLQPAAPWPYKEDHAAGRMIFRNRWHYVVGVYDGENIRMYVDGVPGPATALKDATLDGDGYVSIGGAEWDPFLGRARRLLYHPTSF